MGRVSVNPRVALFVVVALIVIATVWSARASLTPFAVGLALAYLVAPPVARVHRAMPAWLRQRQVSRSLAILLVYFAALASIVGLGALIVPPVVREAQELLAQAPRLAQAAYARVERVVDTYYIGAPDDVREVMDLVLGSDVAARVTASVADAAQRLVLDTAGAVTGTVVWLLALIIVPIWLVYLLGDKDRVMAGAIGLVPREFRPDVEAVRVICDRVLAAYVRGQLVITVILGVMVTVSLFALGVPYALLLGVVVAVLGVIPFAGAILGAIPAIAVAASQSLRLAVIVVVVYTVIQQIDSYLVTPRLQSRAVALNPAVIMFVLVLGHALIGPAGLLVAVPFTAILRDVVHYLYLRVAEDRPTALAALSAVGYGAYATPIIRTAAAAEGDATR